MAVLSDAPVYVHNTMSRQKEVLEPLEPHKVKMYNCGPTVYDYFHVGNARNFVVADMIRRYLAYRGYQVTFVQNITDIEDKIIKKAREEGVDADAIAERYTRIFFESSAALGVKEADHHPRATQYVGKMIGMVQRLEQKGLAYSVEGDVFFRVGQFPEYGKLSGRKLEDMLSGARVEISEKKEHPADFVLWKAAKEGEPSWDSPWGKGRPGWHLECSVMSTDLLGDSFDIHMGGIDLCFPHHENEIAQSEGATGKPFVRYWLHNGFLNVNGEKMSKSLGNFFTIDAVLEKFEPQVVRYFLLSGHYRAPLDFSDAALKEAQTALNRLRDAVQNARELGGTVQEEDERAESFRSHFEEAMNDDFNTPRALATLFQTAGAINQICHEWQEASRTGGEVKPEWADQAASLAALLEKLGDTVLGLDLQPARGGVEDLSEQLLELLIEARGQARKAKQFALADTIRDRLSGMGFELLDKPGGATEWRRH